MLTAKNLTRALIVSGVAISVMPVDSASAISLMIDDFNTEQIIDVTDAARARDGSSVVAPSAIGGERDLFVVKTNGVAGQGVRGSSNRQGQGFLRNAIDEAQGRTTLTWDGFDGNPRRGAVDTDGLGGIDFSPFTQIDLGVEFSDLGGPVDFTIWDADSNATASITLNIPGMVFTGSSTVVSALFSDFTPSGGSLADIFDSVGAIRMDIDARDNAQEGWDSRYSFVQASDGTPVEKIPEPTTILGTAIFGLGGFLAKRKKAQAQNND